MTPRTSHLNPSSPSSSLARRWAHLLLALLVVQMHLQGCSSLIHNLHIKDDSRKIFRIESFGFLVGGTMNLTMHSLQIKPSSDSTQMGFILRKTSSESSAQQDVEEIMENNACILDKRGKDDVFLDLSDKETWHRQGLSHVVERGQEGLYSLIFARCAPSGSEEVSFHLDVKFFNPGPNYLSAGEAPLPTVYASFAAAFGVSLVAWGAVLLTKRAHIHRVHLMMGLLLLLKTLSLVFDAVRYHDIMVTGTSDVWSVVYYIFAFLRGMFLFTVILLIGTGSLMKPYLSERDWRIAVLVWTLQVIDNVAMIVLEETAPGSQGWMTWRDILHLVDVICCCAVLFPIVWSIKALRESAEVDGKAQYSMDKLKLFRAFYIMVVTYVYFTRIVIFLLEATLQYNLLWLGVFFTELANLLFFVGTGYKFQPMDNNPYIPVHRDENENNDEYGLRDDAVGPSGTEMAIRNRMLVSV